MAPIVFPKFEDLPAVPGMPQGSLWGFFDKPGHRDQLGTLNLLTTENLKLAQQEIISGDHVQLDWSLDKIENPGFGRKKFHHKMNHLTPDPAAGIDVVGNDDEIHINTQSSSQWDGFKHAAHTASRMYYNGLHHDVIVAKTEHLRNGIQNWCDAGGIVGRGILLDFPRWYEKTKGKPAPNPCSRYEITVEELEAVAKFQGTEFRQGDILCIRMGLTDWYDKEPDSAKRDAGTTHNINYIGVEGSEKTKMWLWEKHFAAVAADTIAFEAWPSGAVLLHEWLLVHWGTPIGELWELDRLAEVCEKNNKWSFLLTSAPLRVPGGVATPPNAIAIL